MKTNSLTRNDIGEICAGYRDAKHKKGMVFMLAQQYGVKPSRIMAMLEKEGFVMETPIETLIRKKNTTKKRRRYSCEEKAAAVKAVIGGASFLAAAAAAEANDVSVSNWVKQAAAKDGMQRDEWLEFKRKGMRVNPDFEAAVQEMEAAYPALEEGQTLDADKATPLMAARYRKKPVVVEAIPYLREDNIFEVLDFVNDGSLFYDTGKNEYCIKTLEGAHVCSKGDYIIKGVAGEFYPCKPDVFKQTYEAVEAYHSIE